MDAVKKGSGRPTGDTPTGGSPPHSGTEELSPSRRAAGALRGVCCVWTDPRTHPHGHVPIRGEVCTGRVCVQPWKTQPLLRGSQPQAVTVTPRYLPRALQPTVQNPYRKPSADNGLL